MSNFYSLFTSGFALTFGVGLLLLNILFSLKLYYRERTLIKKEQKLNKHLSHVFTEATRKSESLVAAAAEKSSSILSETEAISSYIKDEISVALEETLKKDERSVDKFLSRLESENVQYFKEVRSRVSAQSSEAMAKAAVKSAEELSVFVAELRSKTVSKHTDLEDSLKLSLQEALVDIADYKKDKLKALDDSLPALLQKVAGDYLGRVLTAEDHEKLVLKSLEEAKKEGIFG